PQQGMKLKNTTVTMTLDDIRNLPPLSSEDKKRISKALANPDKDCPAQTPEQLKQFRPLKETHPKMYSELHPDN
ncbi:MAG: hypothetical protein IKR80_02580, partial [Spirochaetales bacterium]|nr:hypothetical protein [Spirochaetales bacterium]